MIELSPFGDPLQRWPGRYCLPRYERNLGHARRIELASDRAIRQRNKISYRFAHWPIWIFVFFIAPGPLTFDLFQRGVDTRMLSGSRRPHGDRDRRAPGPPSRSRARALHHSVHRGSTESSVSTCLLHAGMERSHCVRGSERRWSCLCRRFGRLAAASVLRGRVLSDRHHHLDSWRARPAAPGQTLDPR